MVATIGDPRSMLRLAPLLDADLLMELLQQLAVIGQLERHRSREVQGDVVLDDRDHRTVGADLLGFVLVRTSELVRALAGRVVVVLVAGAVVSGWVLALDAEAVLDGLVALDDQVVIHVDANLIRFRRVA